MLRYADDFVVRVAGSRDDAEAERDALAAFLEKELRMELSMEKTLITAVEDGFEYLGYRVAQTEALRTGRPVGNLPIPLGKLQQLRDAIKARTARSTIGRILARLLTDLNPLTRGWRTYYRHATGASREFSKLDWWLTGRIWRWLREKCRKASGRALLRRFLPISNGWRSGWRDGAVHLRRFTDGGTVPYRNRGTMIANGWNGRPDDGRRQGVIAFWASFDRLAGLATPAA